MTSACLLRVLGDRIIFHDSRKKTHDGFPGSTSSPTHASTKMMTSCASSHLDVRSSQGLGQKPPGNQSRDITVWDIVFYDFVLPEEVETVYKIEVEGTGSLILLKTPLKKCHAHFRVSSG